MNCKFLLRLCLNKHRKLIVSFDVSNWSGIVIGVSDIELTSNGHCERSEMISLVTLSLFAMTDLQQHPFH